MDTSWHRYGVIAQLASAKPSGTKLGRTALMKLIYFLQTVKQVPLGYHFSLYTYGPFDSDVLADLALVQEMRGVTSQTVHYGNGYGYEIEPGEKVDQVKAEVADFLNTHKAAIETVVSEFGALSPATLELSSTLVFAAREGNGKLSKTETIQQVLKIKPRFTADQAEEQWEDLLRKGYLPA